MILHMKSHVAEVTRERGMATCGFILALDGGATSTGAKRWWHGIARPVSLADIAPEFATDPFLKRPRG